MSEIDAAIIPAFREAIEERIAGADDPRVLVIHPDDYESIFGQRACIIFKGCAVLKDPLVGRQNYIVFTGATPLCSCGRVERLHGPHKTIEFSFAWSKGTDGAPNGFVRVRATNRLADPDLSGARRRVGDALCEVPVSIEAAKQCIRDLEPTWEIV